MTSVTSMIHDSCLGLLVLLVRGMHVSDRQTRTVDLRMRSIYCSRPRSQLSRHIRIGRLELTACEHVYV